MKNDTIRQFDLMLGPELRHFKKNGIAGTPEWK